MSLLGRAVDKHGELTRRFIQPGEFEPRVEARTFLALRGECFGIARLEILPDRKAGPVIVDDDKAPGLAQTNRWRETRQIDKRFQRPWRQWIAAEAPDIAAPSEEIVQTRTEAVIKSDGFLRRDGDVLHFGA